MVVECGNQDLPAELEASKVQSRYSNESRAKM